MKLEEASTAQLKTAIEGAERDGDTEVAQLLARHLDARLRFEPEPYQRLPDGNWAMALLMGGRGSGKTGAAAYATNTHALGPPCDENVPGGHRMGIVGPTFGDTVDSCFYSPAGLARMNPDTRLRTLRGGVTVVEWPTGATARIFGAYTEQDTERLRSGGNRSLEGGTLVVTETGACPIASIVADERVLTRAGWRRVLVSGVDAIEEVWSVETDAGAVGCSASHEWLTERGWIATSDLRTSDRIRACSWSGTALAGIETELATSATRSAVCFTERSTSRRTASSLRGSTSTISMAIPATTILPTWLHSLPLPTNASTRRPRSGMRPGAGHLGSRQHPGFATSAAVSTRATSMLASVVRPASSGTTSERIPAGHTRDGCVACAVRSSRPAPAWTPERAPARVRRVSPTGVVAPLHDLMVEHDHEFVLANGLISGNCFDWWEELAAWRQLQRGYDQAIFGLRLGPTPRAVASTTPKNRPLIHSLVEAAEEYGITGEAPSRKDRVVVTRATTHQNPHLDLEVRADLYARYSGTRLGDQELEGLLLGDLGTRYARADFLFREDVPSWPLKIRSWDLAGTEPGPSNEDPDWTAGVRVSFEAGPLGMVNVDDLVHVRVNPAQVEEIVLATARLDGPDVTVLIEQEPGQSGKAQIEHYRRLLRGLVRNVRGVLPTGSKEVRSTLVESAVQQGRVSLTRGSWNLTFLDEAEGFPDSGHDDQIDALSQAFGWMEGARAAGPAQVASVAGRRLSIALR